MVKYLITHYKKRHLQFTADSVFQPTYLLLSFSLPMTEKGKTATQLRGLQLRDSQTRILSADQRPPIEHATAEKERGQSAPMHTQRELSSETVTR